MTTFRREYLMVYGAAITIPVPCPVEARWVGPNDPIRHTVDRVTHDECMRRLGNNLVPRPFINIKCDMESLTYCSLCVNLAQYCTCVEGAHYTYQQRLRPVLLRRRLL